MASEETANFRGDDVESLVAASLSCSICLSSRVVWSLDGHDLVDSFVRCRCLACGHCRKVFLDGEQALRLSLHDGLPLDSTPRPWQTERAVL